MGNSVQDTPGFIVIEKDNRNAIARHKDLDRGDSSRAILSPDQR